MSVWQQVDILVAIVYHGRTTSTNGQASRCYIADDGGRLAVTHLLEYNNDAWESPVLVSSLVSSRPNGFKTEGAVYLENGLT